MLVFVYQVCKVLCSSFCAHILLIFLKISLLLDVYEVPLTTVPSRESVIRLQSQEHDPGVLDGLLDRLEERDRLAAVDEAVVVRQCDEHHRTDHDLNESHVNLGQRSIVAIHTY